MSPWFALSAASSLVAPGSIWALLLDPAARVLRMSMAWPRDELSLFADNIASTMGEVIAHLPALLRVLYALRVAADLALNCAKPAVVNYGPLSDLVLKRRLLATIGVAQMIVARSAVCLWGPHRP